MIKNNYHETYVIGLKQYHIYQKKHSLCHYYYHWDNKNEKCLYKRFLYKKVLVFTKKKINAKVIFISLKT